MKKIGLAVCYDTKNYGSQLQVLATVKKIQELGYDTEIIRYKKSLTPTFVLQTIPRLFDVSFIKAKLRVKFKQKEIKKYPEIEKNISIRNKRFRGFAKKYFTNLSEVYNGWENLVKQSAKNYDLFLCGSDQLWLPNNLGSHFYTLEFAPENKRKIAYATSFGVSQIPISKKMMTKKFLNRIEYIGVRETRAAEIIKELTGRDVPTVLDPTLLFSAQDWLNIIPLRQIPSLAGKKYIFCYFLGRNPQQRREAEKLRAETGCEIVFIPHLDEFIPEDIEFGDVQLFDIGPEEFVNLIRNAEYVCTDSFHGSVFSILYHKSFITFNRFKEHDKNSRNSRIDTLLAQTELENRRFDGRLLEQIVQPIDTVRVDQRLQEMKNYSLSYLADAISRV